MKITVVFLSIFLAFLSVDSKEEYSKINQETALQKSIKRGKEVYNDMCLRCHLSKGEGIPKVYPPLAKSDYLLEKREASIRAVKYGLRGKIVVNGKTYKRMMAKPGLDNDEIADVMNYITNSWGNKYNKMVTEKEVEAITKK